MEVRNETVETSTESSLSTTTRTRKKQKLSLTNNNIDIVQSFRSRTGVLEAQAMSSNDLPLSSSQSLLLTPELVLYNDMISVRAILGLERTNRLSKTRSEEHTSELQSRFDLV